MQRIQEATVVLLNSAAFIFELQEVAKRYGGLLVLVLRVQPLQKCEITTLIADPAASKQAPFLVFLESASLTFAAALAKPRSDEAPRCQVPGETKLI